ncbi:MAG: MCE family protein [Cyclobacteriaceae bacterium]|nr:MCE family protein [Cyclobacteriaceae bacterium]
MKNQAQKIRLGIFLVVSSTILLIIVAYFTAREIFVKEDTYFISFEGISVGGLEIGSPVKYLGIKVGTITDITIDPENVNRVIIELALKPDTPIKTDTRADITSIGITGLKNIGIRGGSNDSKALKPGSYINAGSSITEEITGKAEIIAEKAEKVLNNLQLFTDPSNLDKFSGMIDKITLLTENASLTLTRVDSVVNDNREDIRRTFRDALEISESLKKSSTSLHETVTYVNHLVKGDTLGDILFNFRDVSLKIREAKIGEMIENIARAANQTQELLLKVDNDLDRSSQDFSESLRLLKITLENLSEASRKINDNPSILIRGTNPKEAPDQYLMNKK